MRSASRTRSRRPAEGLRGREIDEVILSTLPPGISRWLGQDVPSKLKGSIQVPVAVVTTQKQTAPAGPARGHRLCCRPPALWMQGKGAGARYSRRDDAKPSPPDPAEPTGHRVARAESAMRSRRLTSCSEQQPAASQVCVLFEAWETHSQVDQDVVGTSTWLLLDAHPSRLPVQPGPSLFPLDDRPGLGRAAVICKPELTAERIRDSQFRVSLHVATRLRAQNPRVPGSSNVEVSPCEPRARSSSSSEWPS